MYVLSWRALLTVRQSLLALAPSEEHDQMLVFGRMLQVALVGNSVSGFFLSMSYSVILWVLFAAAISCVSLVTTTAAAAEMRKITGPSYREPGVATRRIN